MTNIKELYLICDMGFYNDPFLGWSNYKQQYRTETNFDVLHQIMRCPGVQLECY